MAGAKTPSRHQQTVSRFAHLVHQPLERFALLLVRQRIQLPQLRLARLPVCQRFGKAGSGGGGACQAVQQPQLQGLQVGFGGRGAGLQPRQQAA